MFTLSTTLGEVLALVAFVLYTKRFSFLLWAWGELGHTLCYKKWLFKNSQYNTGVTDLQAFPLVKMEENHGNKPMGRHPPPPSS